MLPKVLTFDISILVADGERIFGAHQPADPLAHQKQRAVALLMTHIVHLQQNVLCSRHGTLTLNVLLLTPGKEELK